MPTNEHLITGGQALIDALLTNGADMAFGVPGESYLAALDALYDASDKFQFITCRHEASAANMAEAYGKLTGKPGLCFVTRGPGATHASIGLHTAFQDSTPMIMLIGQVASDQVEREAFQEIDYRRFLSEVTKWSAEINDPNRVAEFIGRAYRVATSGRPGPVALALPEDMLTTLCKPQKSLPYKAAIASPSESDMQTLKAMLAASKRPFLLAGGSGWTREAVQSLEDFASETGMPVSVSFRCQDRFNNNHDNYIGDMGIGANPKLVEAMQQSDLLLVLGPRLGEMTTGGYSRLLPPVTDVPLVHIHQGAEELGRVYQPTLGINAAPTSFLPALKKLGLQKNTAWQARTRELRTAYINWTEPTPNPGQVQIAALYAHMRDHLPEDTILCNGAGNYAAWLHRFYRYRGAGTQLAPTSGAMGYGVPAAIAAKILEPQRTVIACAGDGCFMMSIMELATAVRYKAAVIFLVFNNGMLGTIRMHQEREYPGRISGTDLTNPDFVALAKSFGLMSERITKTEDFAGALERAQNAGGPALLEIMVDPDAVSPTASISSLRKKASL